MAYAWMDHAFDLAHDAGAPPLRWGARTVVARGGQAPTDHWWLAITIGGERTETMAATLDGAAFQLVQRLRPPADDQP